MKKLWMLLLLVGTLGIGSARELQACGHNLESCGWGFPCCDGYHCSPRGVPTGGICLEGN